MGSHVYSNNMTKFFLLPSNFFLYNDEAGYHKEDDKTEYDKT